MNGELRLNMIASSSLPNTTDSGDLYICEDVNELYVDSFDHGRIRISDIIVVNNITARNAITTPLANKFYYVRETNTFYTYASNTWSPVGSGVFTDSSAEVVAARLANNFTISLSGDATGSQTSNGTGTATINVGLSASGVVAGTYGETADKTLAGSGTFVIPKFTVDAKGRVTAVNPVTVTMPASMGLNHIILANSASATTQTSPAITNGNVFINSVKDSAVVDHINITGRGATQVTVETDSIVIESTDDQTTYGASGGIERVTDTTYDYKFQHTNSITAGNVTGSSGSVSFGGSISIPKIVFDSNGHITSTDTTTVTLPATPTDKDVATSKANTTKAYITGTTSVSGGNGALIFDENVYLDTTAGTLSATSFKGNLDGTADKATKDASGNTITTTYAPLNNANLTGAPTAPTASAGTNTTQIATTAFVTAAIAALGDTLTFKGTIGTGGTVTSIPTAYRTGDEYKVITAGTYAGNVCEVGDLIIATVTRTENGLDSDWCVVQGNIDGAVTSGSSGSTGVITVTKPNASTIQVTHNASGATAGTYANNGSNGAHSPALGGTVVVPKIVVNATGHITSISDVTVTLPTYSNGSGISITNGVIAHTNSVTAGSVSSSTTTAISTIDIPTISYDANGHITGSTAKSVTLDFARMKISSTEPSTAAEMTVGEIWLNFNLDTTVPAA